MVTLQGSLHPSLPSRHCVHAPRLCLVTLDLAFLLSIQAKLSTLWITMNDSGIK